LHERLDHSMVPGDVREELAARAARGGQLLQEYLRGMLINHAAHPAVGDVIARARTRVMTTGTRVDASSIVAARNQIVGESSQRVRRLGARRALARRQRRQVGSRRLSIKRGPSPRA
jgi:hypothetical protein